MIGHDVMKFWSNAAADAEHIRRSLQTQEPDGSEAFARLEACFKRWNAWTIDVPGSYYLEVIEKLYKHNELAAGNFMALGQKIDLSRVRIPIYLLAGSEDEVVVPEQLLAVERLVGTPPELLRYDVAPCDHLGLFMGKATLEEYWPRIVRWLKESEVEEKAVR